MDFICQRFLPRAHRELKAVVTYPWECEFSHRNPGVRLVLEPCCLSGPCPGFLWLFRSVEWAMLILLKNPQCKINLLIMDISKNRPLEVFLFLSSRSLTSLLPLLFRQFGSSFFKCWALWQWKSWIPSGAGDIMLEEKGPGKFPWDLWVPAGVGVGQRAFLTRRIKGEKLEI